MTINRPLSVVTAAVPRLRFSRPSRRRRLRTAPPPLVRSEFLEAKVLLSATTEDGTAAETPYDSEPDVTITEAETIAALLQDEADVGISEYLAETENLFDESIDDSIADATPDYLDDYFDEFSSEDELDEAAAAWNTAQTNETENAQTATTELNQTAPPADTQEPETDENTPSLFDDPEEFLDENHDDVFEDDETTDGQEPNTDPEYENGWSAGYALGKAAAQAGQPQNETPVPDDPQANESYRNGYQAGYLAGYQDGLPTDDNPPPTDGTSTDDTTSEPVDPRFDWEPSGFTNHDDFTGLTLPAEAFADDLTLLTPEEGSDSFSNAETNTAEPVTTQTDPALGEGTKTTETSSVRELSQTIASPSEWNIRQSLTKNFTSEEQSVDAEGKDDSFRETGTETLVIDVSSVPGTITTTVTFSVSSVFSHSSGELAADDFDNNSSDPADWAVPASWTDSATNPANDGSKEEKENTNPPSDSPPAPETDNADETVEEQNSNGSRFSITATFTITVTETVTTLSDGITSRTTTVNYSSTNSFVSMASGGYGDSESEGSTVTWNTEAESTNEETPAAGAPENSDAATEDDSNPADTIIEGVTSGGNGHTISASGNFFIYSYATMTSSGSLTVTDSGSDAETTLEPTGNSNFSVSLGSGALVSQKLSLDDQSFSGEASTETDEFEYLSYLETGTSGYATSFDFTTSTTHGAAAAEPVTTQETTETPEETGRTCTCSSTLTFSDSSHFSNGRAITYAKQQRDSYEGGSRISTFVHVDSSQSSGSDSISLEDGQLTLAYSDSANSTYLDAFTIAGDLQSLSDELSDEELLTNYTDTNIYLFLDESSHGTSFRLTVGGSYTPTETETEPDAEPGQPVITYESDSLVILDSFSEQTAALAPGQTSNTASGPIKYGDSENYFFEFGGNLDDGFEGTESYDRREWELDGEFIETVFANWDRDLTPDDDTAASDTAPDDAQTATNGQNTEEETDDSPYILTGVAQDQGEPRNVIIYVINRDGNDDQAGLVNQHIDLLIPGRGLVGFFPNEQGQNNVPLSVLTTGLTGFVNNTFEEWMAGPASRPASVVPPSYKIAQLSTIVRLRITQSQLKKMQDEIDKLDMNPGTFHLATNNCSMNACNILTAGGLLQNVNQPIGIPNELIDALAAEERGQVFGGYTVVLHRDRNGDGKLHVQVKNKAGKNVGVIGDCLPAK